MADGGEIVLRAGRSGDAEAVAELMLEAGGGLFEFLLHGVVPDKTPADLLALAVAGDSGPYSHRNTLVAEAEGRVVAMINAYPAELMKEDPRDLLPQDRLDHVGELEEIEDWSSFFISSMAVAEAYRRKGVATRLLAWAFQQAERQGFDRVSLHVWADNEAARRLYEGQGFVVGGRARIAPHPRLRRAGESLLMIRPLAA